MRTLDDSEYFVAFDVAPTSMDRLWAEGWRHFGWYFFRYRTSVHDDRLFHVVPLRVDVALFEPSRGQRRVLAKNRDVEVVVREARYDGERERLFARHSVRFAEDAPTALDQFISPMPATVPCRCREVALLLDGKLVGVTYLDVGQTSTSAVYAIHEPDLERRSLGILMMLESLRYTRSIGARFYYQGYAYREPFAYDYKKRFAATEALEWDVGWRPLLSPE